MMSNIDFRRAAEIARKQIEELANAVGDNFAIRPELTKEIGKGWVFFYNSVEFLSTGNPTSTLIGNGPILITRNGAIHILPTAIPWAVAVERLKLSSN